MERDAGSGGSIHSAVIVGGAVIIQSMRLPAREKAGGHYAAGLLLQLPAREVRFRCHSMPKV